MFVGEVLPLLHKQRHKYYCVTGERCETGMTRSPAVAEGPRDAGVPVEILAAVERLYYTPNEY